MVVAGPTAVGKSAFGMRIARLLNGEIVSADSRQAYSGLDIGTAKPTIEDRESVPHHLVDILEPDQDYGLVPFLDLARKAIDEIASRDRLPVVVGGSSQYVFALMEGWEPHRVPPDSRLRAALQRRADRDGSQRLHEDLEATDPEAAAQIDPSNTRRVIRALEVRAHAGEGTSPPPRPGPAEGDGLDRLQETTATGHSGAKIGGQGLADGSIAIGFTLPRDELYRRIDARVDGMMALGWLNEVEGLLQRGYSPELSSMSSIGYSELAEHIDGKTDLAGAIQRIKHRTHRLARSQYVWLRRAKWLEWFESDDKGVSRALDRVGEQMAPRC